MIPDALRREVESALTLQFGTPARLDSTVALGGGCISHATRVRTSSGASAFLKWGARGEFAAGLFQCEANALKALAATNVVRVPAVLAVRDDMPQAEFAWLLLEWLDPGPVTPAAWESLGRALAQLHGVQHDRFGWAEPNFIGSLPQSNAWHDAWPAFWRAERIEPQLARAVNERALTPAHRQRIEALLRRVDEIAGPGDNDGPSLLHGDLWGGNVHGLASGTAALIDPASYYGHREVDLAMAHLFGGFDARFFDAYEEAWPLSQGSAQRRMLYQLYYMLVHVNLFGGSYLRGTMSLVAELGF